MGVDSPTVINVEQGNKFIRIDLDVDEEFIYLFSLGRPLAQRFGKRCVHVCLLGGLGVFDQYKLITPKEVGDF